MCRLFLNWLVGISINIFIGTNDAECTDEITTTQLHAFAEDQNLSLLSQILI